MTKKYIDAEELNKLLCEAKSSIPVFNGGICKAKMIVREMPAADVEEVKHGKWIEEKTDEGDPLWACSICWQSFYLDEGTPKENLYFYCPNCGAKMDGKESAKQ